MELKEVYFWTSTVKDWKNLFVQDKYKQLIIDQWRSLTQKELIIVYGFVIMPNHLHVIWELCKRNGKEMPHASFNKATAHLIVKDLKVNHPAVIPYFKVNEHERSFRIWQRDPLAVLMDNKSKVEQKLTYIHQNPLQERWNLATDPIEYPWSSAAFYENEPTDFDFLVRYEERF